MKPETIRCIQTELDKLATVIALYNRLSDNPIVTIIHQVINKVSTENTTEEQLKDTMNFLIALNAFDPYDHFISFVSDEVYMIVHGNEMCEVAENEADKEYKEFMGLDEVEHDPNAICARCGLPYIEHNEMNCP